MGNTHDTEIARIEADHIQTKWRTTDDYRWGYVGDRGPDTWWVHYPCASGGKQSPVDILTEETAADNNFGAEPLQICYHTPPPSELAHPGEDAEGAETKILVNTGATARVNVVNSRSYMTGGPCKGYTYVLEQFHLHWGETDASGSEHYVDSMPYSAEVHLVHWNEDLYGSYEEAARCDEGILILTAFIKVSEMKSNIALNQLSELLEEVIYREQNIPLPREFPVEALLPDDLSKYWTYKGSFTTPPCYETVTWIVLESPIFVSSKVLDRFRQLRCYAENEERPSDEYDGELTSNRRPVQPIGARKVTYVDCDLFRDSHELGHEHQRPFRIGGGGGGPALGVRIAAFQAYVGQHRGDGIHGCSRGG